jgi:hypothetical protein
VLAAGARSDAVSLTVTAAGLTVVFGSAAVAGGALPGSATSRLPAVAVMASPLRAASLRRRDRRMRDVNIDVLLKAQELRSRAMAIAL